MVDAGQGAHAPAQHAEEHSAQHCDPLMTDCDCRLLCGGAESCDFSDDDALDFDSAGCAESSQAEMALLGDVGVAVLV